MTGQTKTYQCADCDREFRSPGALGGHRAQHKVTATLVTCDSRNPQHDGRIPHHPAGGWCLDPKEVK